MSRRERECRRQCRGRRRGLGRSFGRSVCRRCGRSLGRGVRRCHGRRIGRRNDADARRDDDFRVEIVRARMRCTNAIEPTAGRRNAVQCIDGTDDTVAHWALARNRVVRTGIEIVIRAVEHRATSSANLAYAITSGSGRAVRHRAAKSCHHIVDLTGTSRPQVEHKVREQDILPTRHRVGLFIHTAT